MNYRREIDGLRAIAVLPVILFHAGFEIFSGGYVGVDVFFVISGYLITTIILRELKQEKFSIVNFYERRARRILPALFVVMLVCIPFAWFSLLPSEMKDFSKSLIAVSVFASNILFWRESGYFETAAELKPLLHTWSLAVEEQFYLIFPLVMVFSYKLRKKWIIFGFGLIFLSSLSLAQWAAYVKPAAAFFLLPTRVWEFFIGVFAAYYLENINRKTIGKTITELCGWLGVVLIFFAIFAFSKSTPFPSIYTLVPTIGAVLIIIFANNDTTVGKFLGNRLFVGVGLISYSAYLWHQPLFAFASHAGYSKYDKSIFIWLSIASIVLAYVTWLYVEKRFRSNSVLTTKTIFISALIGSLFFACLGLYGYVNKGNLGQISDEQKIFLDNFENDLPEWKYSIKEGLFEKYRLECDFFDIQKYRVGNPTTVPLATIPSSCFTKSNNSSKVIFIWGDSHAQQLYYGLSKNLNKDHELLQVASSGCTPSMISANNRKNFCEYSNWFALDVIKKIKPEVVIVGKNLGHDANEMEFFTKSLKKFGVSRVIFTGPSPHWSPSLPAVIARMLPDVPQRSTLGLDKGVLELDSKLKIIASRSTDFEYISLIDYFCNETGCLLYYDLDIAANVTSHDYGHLSPLASYHLAKDLLIDKILNHK
jgi:peptidoglycan/LPS O-acetylase OafA/YrhL